MDKVLNLSAFGEIIKNPNKMEPDNTKSSNKNIVPTEESKYGHIFKMILQNSAQAKLLHWQCALYGQHKALDKLFGNIIEIGDGLAESIMGKYGKPVLTEDQLCLKLMNFEDPKDGDLSQFMDHLYKCYSIDCKSLLDENSDSELINILDEMIAAIDQTKYLISLR
jgi:DNA-binding ferritin-like protein